MVCAGITHDAVNKKITIQYNASDGTKGASFTDPYRLDDIYDTAVAGGWDSSFKKENAAFILDCSIYILGSTTYAYFYNQILIWTSATPVYLIYVDGAYFNVGSDGTVDRVGCVFFNDKGLDLKGNYRLFGRIKIYDTTFTGRWASSGNGAIYPYGYSDYKLVLERCQFINMTYSPSFNLAGASYANVIHKDNFLLNNKYGIQLYATQFYELSGLRAIGKIFTLLGSKSMTVIGRNWNCPRGTSDFRVLGGSPGKLVTVRLIDCITGTIDPRVHYADSYVGDKGITQWESTFSFKIENGAGAAIKLYNADEEEVLDDTLDENGELSGQEIIYRIYSMEKTGESSWLTINKYVHPFKAVISKAGYQTAEIPGIEVTNGVPTIIQGSLLANLPAVYIDRRISGTIPSRAVTGSLQVQSLTGRVQ